MPFGLCNAAQTQQRLMDSIFGPSMDDSVFVYLDDIIIATPTFEKHLEVLQEVHRRLKEANLTINLKKCKFCLPSLKYLGFVIDQNGLRTDPEKVTAMLNFPKLETVTQLKRFLGMCGYYRRFLKNFSSLTAPMTALMKGKRKTQKLEWNEEAKQCFTQIKEVLVSAPLLASPDYKKPFSIHCDASSVGLGCMLSQTNENGEEVTVAYASRTLSEQEKRYTVTELELAAVLFGVEKFRPYVEGA
ncbi:RNase H-like domain found in reverse transcriptase [Popillia japonica]|uniref:RNase H-like domain found in reverse transcriptase n=1 Tax=Popillia japonica TaxID=7064 RepID=A0AAW1HWI1_POPJA